MSSTLEIKFAGQRFVLDAGLGLYWPAQETLVVSDLHLEKATYLTQFGSPLAPYDTLDTLLRLEALVAKYKPISLILLGDSFHDQQAWERLEETARLRLLSICSSVETCHMIEGNHDLGLMTDAQLQFADDIQLNGIVFRHEPKDSPMPQVIGHFHPKLYTSLHGHRLIGKCFAMNQNLFIMPAFGTFTGGLDMRDQVFTELAGGIPLKAYVVYRKTIAPVDYS